MHIITGLIVGALLGKRKMKKNASFAGLPKLDSDPVQLVHALPGRIRVRVQSLKGNSEAADTLMQLAPRVDGIDTVNVDVRTGSILVSFDERKVRPDFLFAALVRFLGLEKEMEKPPNPVLKRELNDFGSSINRSVYEKTGGVLDLKTGIFLALGILGVRRLITGTGYFWPAGLTMMWWAMNGLTKQDS